MIRFIKKSFLYISFFPTNRAWKYFSAFGKFFHCSTFPFKLHVFTWRKNFKIFYSVVCFYSIYMVNYLFLSKKPSKFFLHNQSMFIDITPWVCMWMFGHSYKNISLAMFG